MEKAAEGEAKSFISKKQIKSIRNMIIAIIMLIVVEYLSRINGNSNFNFPEGDDKYIFWPLILIFIYFVFRSNPPKSFESDIDLDVTSSPNKSNYIFGLLIFGFTYALQFRYVSYSFHSDSAILNSTINANLHYLFNSVIATYVVLAMRNDSVFHYEMH